MTNFFTTRTNRFSATVMLLLWIFGLTAGVANACLLQAQGVAHTLQTTPSTSHDEKHGIFAGHLHTGVIAADEGDAHTSRQPCLRVCDDSSKTLPKKYPAGQMEQGLQIVVAVLWSQAEPVRLQHQLPVSSRPAPPLPLRVLYSRLAV